MTSHDDGGALHRTALDRRPGPLAVCVIVDLVIFDAGIVTPVRAAGPVEEYSQLHVVDLVLADHQMRGIGGAHAAAAGIRAIEAHFEALDPQPITAVRIEGLVECRYLPVMTGRVIPAAHEQLGCRCIEKPALDDRNLDIRKLAVSEALGNAHIVVVPVEACLIARQIRNGLRDLCEINTLAPVHNRPHLSRLVQ